MWHWVQESYRVSAVECPLEVISCRLQGTAYVYKVLWHKGMGTWVSAGRYRVLGTGYQLEGLELWVHVTAYMELGTDY